MFYCFKRSLLNYIIVISAMILTLTAFAVSASAAELEVFLPEGINADYSVKNRTLIINGEDALAVIYKDSASGNTVELEIHAVSDDGGCVYVAPNGVSELTLCLKGDCNGDGRLDENDIELMKNIVLDLSDSRSADLFVCDVSRDGRITAYDLALLNAAVKGKISLWYSAEDASAFKHTELTDPAVSPTCTESGLGEGKHCSECGLVTLPQAVILATGHVTVSEGGKPATERTFGYAPYEYCTVCQTVISNSELLLPTEIKNPEYYSSRWGYNYLATLPGGAAMQSFYNALAAEISDFHINTDRVPSAEGYLNPVNYSKFGLTAMQACTVYSIFLDDNPLYYWVDISVAWSSVSLYAVVNEEYRQSAVRAHYNELIYAKAAEYLKLTINESSEYQIAWALHDAICMEATYAFEADGVTPQDASWAHSIIGILEKNEGVCESYTEVFGLLLNFAGVENIRVEGTGNGGGHAWNLVKLDDGEWYWYDLTWDDVENENNMDIFHAYMAVNDYQQVDVQIGRWYYPTIYFFQKHIPYSSGNYGINYNPVLPARAADAFTTDDTMVYDQFKIGGTTYEIIRFDTAYCSSYLGMEPNQPETVTYNGREYKVIVG